MQKKFWRPPVDNLEIMTQYGKLFIKECQDRASKMISQ